MNLGDFNNKRVEGSVSGRFSTDISVYDVAEYLGDKLYETIKDELLIAQELAPSKSYIHAIVTN